MELTNTIFGLPAMCLVVCTLVATGLTDSVSAIDPRPRQDQPTPLPEGYVAYRDIGFAYKVHDVNVPFKEASSRCMQEGAKLALIDTAKKIEYVKRQKQSSDYAHVGVVRMYDNTTWVGVATGLPVSSLPWYDDNPNNSGYCVKLFFEGSGLTNNPCNSSANYICELPIVENSDVTNPAVDQPAPLPEGYVAHPDIGFAYKYYGEEVSWIEARSRCMQEGAQLALLDSTKKLRYVTRQKQSSNYAHVGIVRMYDDETWVGVATGLPVSSVPWYGSPSRIFDCAVIFFLEPALINYSCSLELGYVCELPIPEMSTIPALCYVVDTLVDTGITGINVTDSVPAVDQTPPQHQPAPLPEGYVAHPDIGFAYKLYDEKVTFQEAKYSCIAEGAQLALIDTAKKIEYVKSQFPVVGYAYVGIVRSSDHNDTWVAASTGLPVASLPWYSNNPDGRGDCVLIGFLPLHLITDYCEGTSPYICEMPICV